MKNPFELDEEDTRKLTSPPPMSNSGGSRPPPSPLQNFAPVTQARDTSEKPVDPFAKKMEPPKPNQVHSGPDSPQLQHQERQPSAHSHQERPVSLMHPQGYPPSGYPPSPHQPVKYSPQDRPVSVVHQPSQPVKYTPQDRPVSVVHQPVNQQSHGAQQQQQQYPPQFAQPLQPAQKLIKFEFNSLLRDQPSLAKGSYGVVYTGKAPGIEKKVVIKDMTILNQKSVDDWRREALLMGENKSPFVADVFGYSSLGNTLTIVMEFFPFGDLYAILHKRPEKHPLSILQRLRMARHCTHGILFLHSKSIIHRDIKSMNILVTEDYTCKLTDFGNAKLIQQQAGSFMMTQNSGTPLWMAPEVKTGNYSFPADIFSLGLVFYELFEKKLPVYNPQLQRVEVPSSFKSASLVMPMINVNASQRTPLTKVLADLDQKVNDFVSEVLTGMPQKGLEKLKADAGVKLEEDEKTDEVKGKLLHTLYKQLLTRPPTEIDPLCVNVFPSFKGGVNAQVQGQGQGQFGYGAPQAYPSPVQGFPMQQAYGMQPQMMQQPQGFPQPAPVQGFPPNFGQPMQQAHPHQVPQQMPQAHPHQVPQQGWPPNFPTPMY